MASGLVFFAFLPWVFGWLFFFLLVGPNALCSDDFHLLSTGSSLAEIFQDTPRRFILKLKTFIYDKK